MKEFQSISLRNVVYYKDAELRLDHVGITTVYGDNRMTNSKERKSNGSGKSLLLSAIPNLRYDALPVSGNLPKAKLRRELLTHADSTIALTMKDDATAWTFAKHSKGKSVEYEVLRNGKSPKVRRQGYAQELMEKALPWSEEEFFTTIYLDSRRPAYIRFGNPAARMAFFTTMFGLDNYDDMRRRLKVMSDELKTDTKRLAATDVELSTMPATLDADYKALVKDQQYYQGELDIVLPKMEDLQAKIHSVTTTAEQADNVQRLVEVCHRHNLKSLTEKRILKLSEDLKAQRASLREQLREAHAYEERQAHYKRWKTSLDALSHDGETYAEAKAQTAALAKELETLETLIEGERNKKHTAEANLRALRKPKHVEEVDDPGETDVDALQADYDEARAAFLVAERDTFRLRKLLDAVGSDCVCPTCDTELNRKDLKALFTKYEEEQTSNKRAADKAASLLGKVKAYAAYTSYAEEHAAYVEEQQALNKKLRRATTKVGALLDQRDGLETTYNRMRDLRKLLKAEVEKPERPNIDEGLQQILDNLSEDISLLSANSSLASIVSSLVDDEGHMLSAEDITANLPKLRKKYRQWVEYSQGIQADMVNNTTKLAEHKALIERRDQLLGEKVLLSANLEDLPVYDMLMDAFGQKGIKMLLLQSICTKLSKTMNKYAPLLFAEDFEFSFEVKSNVDFSIMVTRKSGKKPLKSDVRNLSGAEGRQFDYLFTLAMLPMTPAHRRSNILIFDEPTTNMDDAAKDLFINSFIPKLASIVPSVIIITPLSNEVYPHARRVRVVKEKGVSRVEIEKSTIVKED